MTAFPLTDVQLKLWMSRPLSLNTLFFFVQSCDGSFYNIREKNSHFQNCFCECSLASGIIVCSIFSLYDCNVPFIERYQIYWAKLNKVHWSGPPTAQVSHVAPWENVFPTPAVVWPIKECISFSSQPIMGPLHLRAPGLQLHRALMLIQHWPTLFPGPGRWRSIRS